MVQTHKSCIACVFCKYSTFIESPGIIQETLTHGLSKEASMSRWLGQFLSSSNIQATMMNSNAIHLILLLFGLPSCNTVSLKNFADQLASSDCLTYLVFDQTFGEEACPPVISASSVLHAIYSRVPEENGRYTLFLIQRREIKGTPFNTSISLRNQNDQDDLEVSDIIGGSWCTNLLTASKYLDFLEPWNNLPYGRVIVFSLKQPTTDRIVTTGAQNLPVLQVQHGDSGEMGQLRFLLLCYLCEHQWLQLSDIKIPKILEEDRKQNRRESGFGSVATVMGRFNWKQADHLRFCELQHYYFMTPQSNGVQCSFNEIILQTVVRHFNLSLKAGDFHDREDPEKPKVVVHVCVFLCFLDRAHYTEDVYMLAMNFDPIFFLYCESTEKLKDSSWSVLVNSFDSSVWILLISCSVLIGIFQKGVSNSVNFMALLLGHSLIKIRRASVFSAVFLITPMIFSSYYQGSVISDVTKPRPPSAIPTIKILFKHRKFKLVLRQGHPPDPENVWLKNFNAHGLEFLDEYFLQDAAGGSPLDALGQARIAGKYAGVGIVMVLKPVLPLALAVTRFQFRDITCNFVNQNWASFAETWLFKGSIGREVYATTQRLIQSGHISFWKQLINFRQMFSIKGGTTDGGSEKRKPLSLKSSFEICLRINGILLGVLGCSSVLFACELLIIRLRSLWERRAKPTPTPAKGEPSERED